MKIYIETPKFRIIPLEVESNDTIEYVKKMIWLKEISGVVQKLRYGEKDLEDGRTLAYYNIVEYSTLRFTSAGVAPPQTKRPRLVMDSGLIAPCVTASIKAKLNDSALLQDKATAALSDPMPEICAHPPPSVPTELEDLKWELATSHSKEKELEATISRQTQKHASFENQIVCLKTEFKKTEEELSVARDKEKELEATISALYKVISTMCGSYESQLFALKGENKETQQELKVARNKEKELEAANSRLAHENQVFSAQCASYESQIVALEAENKTYKEEMTVVGSLKAPKKERESGSNP